MVKHASIQRLLSLEHYLITKGWQMHLQKDKPTLAKA